MKYLWISHFGHVRSIFELRDQIHFILWTYIFGLSEQNEPILDQCELVGKKTPFPSETVYCHVLLEKCLKLDSKWRNFQKYWPIFNIFVSVDIYLFSDIILSKKIGHFVSSDVKILHFLAEEYIWRFVENLEKSGKKSKN